MTSSKQSQTRQIVKALPFILPLLICGSANTVLYGVQNTVVVGPDGETYDQAVWQTITMVIGEMFCFVLYHFFKLQYRNSVKKWHEKHPDIPYEISDLQEGVLAIKFAETHPKMLGIRQCIFFAASLCDSTGTCMMYLGLKHCAPSTYQMIRGFVIVLTTFMDVFILNVKIAWYKWVALVLICIAIAEIGWSATKYGGVSDGGIETSTFGIIIVLVAQVFPAYQYIIEEQLLGIYAISPVKAIGLEGLGGFLYLSTLIPILGLILAGNSDFGRYFDYNTGFNQTWTENWTIIGTGIVIVFSTSIYNFTGLSIARILNSAARSTIDSSRTIVVWIFSLVFGLENFVWQQLPGFALLTFATFLFNDAIYIPSEPAEHHDKIEVSETDSRDPIEQATENGAFDSIKGTTA